jgi:streptogramin lyase
MCMQVKAAHARTQLHRRAAVLIVVVVAAAGAIASPAASAHASVPPQPVAAVRAPEASIAASPPVGTVTVVDHRGLAAPGQIVAAANGDLWFLNGTSIGRITIAGEITIFADPGIQHPFAIAAGSDGNAWFTNAGSAWGSTVGRITPDGVVTTFGIPGQGQAIVAGADGALWTYMKLGDRLTQVYRITTDGIGSYTPLAGPFDGFDGDETSRLAAGADGSIWYDGPWGCTCDSPALCSCVGRYFEGVVHELAPGRSPAMVRTVVTPDGDLWFTTASDAIGRMHPDGEWTLFHDAAIHGAQEITVGPDGALWFTNGDASLGRITLEGVVSTFAGPGIDHPRGVAPGADGAIWFTNLNNAVGRITPAGAITTFTHPGIVAPGDPVLGADGALWFANGPSSIGRTTDAGELTVFTDARIGSPSKLWAGSDGNLYFYAASGLGQITPDGTFSYFATPPYPPGAFPRSFPDPQQPMYENVGGSTLGPDGNQWMTVSVHVDYRPYKPVILNMAAVVRLSPAGVRTYFPLPDLHSPGAIVAGPDGNLWFADVTIVRITTAGVMTSFPSSGAASDIAVGPDGALWYVAPATDAVGRITTDGVVTSFTDPSIHGPNAITAGPNGSLWFVNGATATLGRIQAATPAPGSAFHPVVPQRILDSRGTTGGWGAKLVAGSPRQLQVRGVATIPATATAAVLNVTATGSDVGSFLSVSPGGGATTVSNLNFAAGETIPNLVTAKLGPTGSVVLATALGSVDVVADVVGYYDDGTGGGDLYNGVTPTRLLDSRGPIGGWNAPLTAGAPRTLSVRQPGNPAGVPTTATAVIANVTATEATTGSFLSVWPTGVAPPAASNLNFGAGQTIANLVIVGIGADGSISLGNAAGAVDVVVDVVGYFDPSVGSRFHAITPTRVLDDRVGRGLAGAWGAGQARALPVAGAPGTGVPVAATGLVVNLTATDGTAGSFVTAYPDGGERPASSTLNFGPGQTIANLTTVALPGDGALALFNAAGTVDLIGDVTGYYASP